MNDAGEKDQLPVYITLGDNDFAKIKMGKSPRVGKIGKPFAELTKLGSAMMSPGRESDVVSALYTQTSVSDYAKLCSTDILGLEERHYNHDEFVFEKFKNQLSRSKKGWHKTGLIWRENNIPLGNNKCGSLNRLKSLLKNLDQKQEVREAYDSVIKDQLENNILKEVTDTEINNSSKEFYMPLKAVIRESAKSTKLRVVYDAFVKSESGLSLNDCLEKGQALQNKLWDILIRTRFRPVVICGDITKAFFQIRIRQNERDCLRLHWSEKANYGIIKIFRFTRLSQSPFVLEGTLKTHFENYIVMFSELIKRMKNGMYVDDLEIVGESTSEVNKVKGDSVELFQRGAFKLHNWHSNEQALETNDSVNENELNFAKQQLGTKPK